MQVLSDKRVVVVGSCGIGPERPVTVAFTDVEPTVSPDEDAAWMNDIDSVIFNFNGLDSSTWR